VNWINQILQGALLGGYYALIACGLSFLFSVMGVINVAHGSLAVLAAFALFALADGYGVDPFLGLLIVVPLMALLGWAFQVFILQRTLRAGLLVPLLSTFGLSILIDNLLFEKFGADTRSLAPYLGSLAYDSWSISDEIDIGQLSLLIFVTAIVLLGGLQMLLSWTPLGRRIRATAADPETVGLLGIDAKRTNAIAVAIAMATVGIAGAAMAMRATFDPFAGEAQMIFAFEAAVIGGVGSLWGTFVGGVVLGIAQTLGAQAHPQGFFIAGHATFLCVLLLRLRSADFRALVRAKLRMSA
jgi:branched-chain amino acid transport system permease protein